MLSKSGERARKSGERASWSSQPNTPIPGRAMGMGGVVPRPGEAASVSRRICLGNPWIGQSHIVLFARSYSHARLRTARLARVTRQNVRRMVVEQPYTVANDALIGDAAEPEPPCPGQSGRLAMRRRARGSSLTLRSSEAPHGPPYLAVLLGILTSSCSIVGGALVLGGAIGKTLALHLTPVDGTRACRAEKAERSRRGRTGLFIGRSARLRKHAPKWNREALSRRRSRALLQAAMRSGVDRFVNISTDKGAKPCSS
jgi:hypothetical protein